jgi:hypothetical protein
MKIALICGTLAAILACWIASSYFSLTKNENSDKTHEAHPRWWCLGCNLVKLARILHLEKPK